MHLSRLPDKTAARGAAGENQEKVAAEETLVCQNDSGAILILRRREWSSRVAQKVEERFHNEFDGLDFTTR
jgi:hypothetical protein